MSLSLKKNLRLKEFEIIFKGFLNMLEAWLVICSSLHGVKKSKL